LASTVLKSPLPDSLPKGFPFAAKSPSGRNIRVRFALTKKTGSAYSGNPAISTIETRGFPSPAHAGFGFGSDPRII
jgi:hypothetical protein